MQIVHGGPETLFRIERLRADGPVMRASMPIGPWMSDENGALYAGSLGVLIDNVLGYAIIAARPPDHWSVSTEITLDVFDGLQSPLGHLHAEAEVSQLDATGGFAIGKVSDDTGRLLALCTQRGRFIRAELSPSVEGAPHRTVEATSMEELLAVRQRPSASVGTVHVEVSANLQNPMHNLHGGISLSLSDIAARSALGSAPTPSAVTSIRAAYTRPVPGGCTAAFAASVQHRGRSFGLVDVVGRVNGKACVFARVSAG